LRYSSKFHTTISDKGWIGFSRTPHSDATFSGEITLDDHKFQGEPLGFGIQGHNCGYRHRGFWTWTHAHFSAANGASTFEALVYDMPFGLWFGKAVLWHGGEQYAFRKINEISRSRDEFRWEFRCSRKDGTQLDVSIDGRGPAVHRLPYVKTNCSGSFEVLNNSLATATVLIAYPGGRVDDLSTETGAVLEMGGERS